MGGGGRPDRCRSFAAFVPYRSTNAFVLSREPSGESMLRLQLFAETLGVLPAYRRISRSRTAAASPPPDLFDRIDAVLETRNEGRTWFLKEYTVTRRFAGLGQNYRRLEYASRLASILLKNPIHGDAAAALFADFETALCAWEEDAPPETVFLKALYVYARDEGFPVREDWRRGLPSARRDAADALIHRPLRDQPESALPHAVPLIESLQNWLRDHHDLRF